MFQIGSISSFYLSVFIMNEWPWRFVFLFWSTITFIWSILFVGIFKNQLTFKI